ncbi:MAG: cellulase family glycosylhydrolase [Acidobacteriota bacterium]
MHDILSSNRRVPRCLTSAPSRRLWALALACCLSLTLASTASAVRGRPTISDGTLLSDHGTPLRGSQYALDVFGGSPPPPGWIEGLPSRGINALHVYAESIVFTHRVGDNFRGLHDIVQRAAASDLYVVITIGGHPENACNPNSPEVPWEQFAFDFWNRYAREFSRDTHVIYELQNEAWFQCCPGECVAQPSPSSIVAFQAETYRIARHAAPDTPILLYSYAFFHDGPGVVQDIDAIEAQLQSLGAAPIDWQKTGIAFHGYAQAEATEGVIRHFDALPASRPDYALVETELAVCPQCQGTLDIPLIVAYETTRTSWFSFLPWNRMDDTHWNDVLDAAFVTWAADDSPWPGTSQPPVGQDIALFSPVGAGAYVRVDAATEELIADAGSATPATRFEVGANGRFVTLKSRLNGKYVRRGVDDRLRADSAAPVTFEWIDLPDGQVVLQATSNWRFVGADYNQTPAVLVGDRPLPIVPPILAAAWERFQVQELAEPSCGGLVQEAEDGELSAVFEVQSEGSRTYIEVPNGTFSGAQAPNDAWKATYCVTVPTSGTYHIKAQVRAPNFDADSFYVRIDGGPVHLWVPRPLGNWTTDRVNDTLPDPDVDPLEVTLSAGEHTVEFLLREDGTQLDALALVKVVQ